MSWESCRARPAVVCPACPPHPTPWASSAPRPLTIYAPRLPEGTPTILCAPQSSDRRWREEDASIWSPGGGLVRKAPALALGLSGSHPVPVEQYFWKNCRGLAHHRGGRCSNCRACRYLPILSRAMICYAFLLFYLYLYFNTLAKINIIIFN